MFLLIAVVRLAKKSINPDKAFFNETTLFPHDAVSQKNHHTLFQEAHLARKLLCPTVWNI